MSIIGELIVGGWSTTAVMIGVCALNDSGKLLKAHKRLGEWLETLAPTAALATLGEKGPTLERISAP